MMFVAPPGGVAGDLTPEGNLGAWIDRALMAGISGSRSGIPRACSSTIPAISTTLLGVVAGLALAAAPHAAAKRGMLAIGGAVLVVAGQLWHFAFPINKNLWTSSYVFFTAGLASLLLAALYWAIDLKGWRGWTKPFVILGSNAITLFVASGMLVKTLALIRVAGDDGREVSVSRYAYTALVRAARVTEERVAAVRARQPRHPLSSARVDVPPPHDPPRVTA